MAIFFNYICRNKTDIMEKQEIFDKFTDFLKQGKVVEQVYPEILEKHGALDITTGFADKLDGISDPFERLIVGVHCVDQLDTKNWNLLPNNESCRPSKQIQCVTLM